MNKKTLFILSIIIILVLFLSACEQENVAGEGFKRTSLDQNELGGGESSTDLTQIGTTVPSNEEGTGNDYSTNFDVPKIKWSKAPSDVFLSVGESLSFDVSAEVVPVKPIVPVVPSSLVSGVAVSTGVAVVVPVKPIVPVVPSSVGSLDDFYVSYFVEEVVPSPPVVPSSLVSGVAVSTGVAVVVPVVPVVPSGYSFVVSDSGLIESVGVLVPGEYVLRVSAVLSEGNVVVPVVPVVPSSLVSGVAVSTGVAVVVPIVPVVPSPPVVGDDSTIVDYIEAEMVVTVTEDNQIYLQWLDNYAPREEKISQNSLSKNIPIQAKVMNADDNALYSLKYSLINFGTYTNLISINSETGVITANEGLNIGNYNFDIKVEIDGVVVPVNPVVPSSGASGLAVLPPAEVDEPVGSGGSGAVDTVVPVVPSSGGSGSSGVVVPSYIVGTYLIGNMDIKIVPSQMPYNIIWVEEPQDQIVEFGNGVYYDIDAEIKEDNVEAEILYGLNEIGYIDQLIDPETTNIAGAAIGMNNNAQASISNFIIDSKTGEIKSNGNLAVGTYNIEVTATLLSYSPTNIPAQEQQDLPIAGAAVMPPTTNNVNEPVGSGDSGDSGASSSSVNPGTATPTTGDDEPVIDPSATSTTTSGTTTQTGGSSNQVYVNEISKTIIIQVVKSLNQCKLILDTPGMIYTLDKDLTKCDNDFVVMITADNAGIDCQGHKIKTSGNNAIFAQKADGIVIKNCNIELSGDNSQGGIILSEVNDAKVMDNKIKAPSYAIYIDENSEDNELINNDLTVTKSYMLADNSNIDEYNKLIYENEFGRIEWVHTTLTINEAGTVGLNKASVNLFQQLTEGVSNFVMGIFKDESSNLEESFEYDSSIMINKNFIGVDTENYPSLTKSAKLYFSNLDFSDYAKGTKYPKRNSQECGEICEDFVKISDNEYSFDVTTFSYYSIGVRDVNNLELYWDIAPENQDITYGEEFYYTVQASGADNIKYTIEEFTDADYPSEEEQIDNENQENNQLNNENILTGNAVVDDKTNNNFEEENDNDDVSNNCADNGEEVYINSGFGSTECCDNNAGIKPVASLAPNGGCIAPSNGQVGTCVVGWDQTCGDGTCSSEEDRCNCPADCGDNNGNVLCTAEGEITNPTLGPNYSVPCCDDLELLYLGLTREINGVTEMTVGSASVCYDVAKGEPVCNKKGTDNEGYYYPDSSLLLLTECDGETNNFVKTQNFAIDTTQGIIRSNKQLPVGKYVLDVTAYVTEAEPLVTRMKIIVKQNQEIGLVWVDAPTDAILNEGEIFNQQVIATAFTQDSNSLPDNYEIVYSVILKTPMANAVVESQELNDEDLDSNLGTSIIPINEENNDISISNDNSNDVNINEIVTPTLYPSQELFTIDSETGVITSSDPLQEGTYFLEVKASLLYYGSNSINSYSQPNLKVTDEAIVVSELSEAIKINVNKVASGLTWAIQPVDQNVEYANDFSYVVSAVGADNIIYQLNEIVAHAQGQGLNQQEEPIQEIPAPTNYFEIDKTSGKIRNIRDLSADSVYTLNVKAFVKAFGSEEEYIEASFKVIVGSEASSNCNIILDQEGETFTLDQDLKCSNTNKVITITANDVTVDCNNYDISLTNGANVIYAEKVKNVIVKNCNIGIKGKNSEGGIVFVGVENSLIDNNDIRVPQYAIAIYDGANNIIDTNSLMADEGYALLLNSDSNLIVNNEFDSETDSAVAMYNSDHNRFGYNFIYAQYEIALELFNSNYNNFDTNTIQSDSNLIWFDKSVSNTLLNNYLVSNFNLISSSSLTEEEEYAGGTAIDLVKPINSLVYETKHGSVEWEGELNIPEGGSLKLNRDIMVNKNHIKFDAELFPSLNTKAKIMLKDVNLQLPTGGIEKDSYVPYRNGEICSDEICSNFEIVNTNTFAFDVAGFSSYSVGVKTDESLIYWDPIPEDQTVYERDYLNYDLNAVGINVGSLIYSLKQENLLSFTIDKETGLLQSVEPLEAGSYLLDVVVQDAGGVADLIVAEIKINVIKQNSLSWTTPPIDQTLYAGSDFEYQVEAFGPKSSVIEYSLAKEFNPMICVQDIWLNSGEKIGEDFVYGEFELEVLDVYDDKAIFILNGVSKTLSKGETSDFDSDMYEVGLVDIFNDEGTENDVVEITFCFQDINSAISNEYFTIDKETGKITNKVELPPAEFDLRIVAEDINGYAESISDSMEVSVLDPKILQWYNLPTGIISYAGEPLEFRITALGTKTIEYNFVNEYECFEIDSLSGVIKSICDLEAGDYTLEVSASDLSGELDPIYGAISINIIGLQAQSLSWVHAPENVYMYIGNEFEFKVEAQGSDNIEYGLIDEEYDDLFIINADGIITNTADLDYNDYLLNVTAIDLNDNLESISKEMIIRVVAEGNLIWSENFTPNDKTITEGDNFVYNVKAEGADDIEYALDGDLDHFTYQLVNVDDNMELFQVSADSLNKGTYHLIFFAESFSLAQSLESPITLIVEDDNSGGGSHHHSSSSSYTTTTCEPNWECTAWTPSNCPVTGRKLRTCKDLNNCNDVSSKPETSKYCNYVSVDEHAVGFEIEEPTVKGVSTMPPTNQQTPETIDPNSITKNSGKGNMNLLTIIIIVVVVLLLAVGGFFLFKKLKSKKKKQKPSLANTATNAKPANATNTAQASKITNKMQQQKPKQFLKGRGIIDKAFVETSDTATNINSADVVKIKSYINACVAKGFSMGAAKARLLKAGWDSALIEKVISEFKN